MRAISTVMSACLVLLSLTACSLIPGMTASEADNPVLNSAPLVELILTSDDLADALGGEWPERFPLDYLSDGQEQASQFEEQRASIVDLLGPECGDAYLTGYQALFEYREAAVVGFGVDPDFASVAVYRMEDSDAASAVVSAFGSELAVCREAAEASSTFSLTDEETSLEGAALVHFEFADNQAQTPRTVFVNMGSLVIDATSFLSAAAADEVVQVQLDKIKSMIAVGVTSGSLNSPPPSPSLEPPAATPRDGLPEGFPASEVPVIEGEIQLAERRNCYECRGYWAIITVADGLALDQIKAQLLAAGFELGDSSREASIEFGGYLNASTDDWSVYVEVKSDYSGFAAIYYVEPVDTQ